MVIIVNILAFATDESEESYCVHFCPFIFTYSMCFNDTYEVLSVFKKQIKKIS